MRHTQALSRWTLVAAIGLGAGLADCSTNSTTGDPNGTVDMASNSPADLTGADLSGVDLSSGGPGVDAACTSDAQSICTKFQECSPFGYNYLYSSMSLCVARYKQYCLAYFGLPGSTRTAADVQRCAAAALPLSCMDYYDATSAYQVGCRSTGTLTDGSACGANDQCQSQYCNINYTTLCGVCARYVKINNTCQNTTGSPACEPGTICVGPSGSQTCQAQSGLSGSCNTTNGPYCKFPLVCRTGSCQQPRQLGDTCDPTIGTDCDSTKDVGCNSTTRKCENLYRYVPAGMSCGSSPTPPYPFCSGSSRCSVTTGTGTCIAPAADGAACNTGSTPPGCQAPANCISGFCRFPSPAMCK